MQFCSCKTSVPRKWNVERFILLIFIKNNIPPPQKPLVLNRILAAVLQWFPSKPLKFVRRHRCPKNEPFGSFFWRRPMASAQMLRFLLLGDLVAFWCYVFYYFLRCCNWVVRTLPAATAQMLRFPMLCGSAAFCACYHHNKNKHPWLLESQKIILFKVVRPMMFS